MNVITKIKRNLHCVHLTSLLVFFMMLIVGNIQSQEKECRTIYLMRAKQFYGSGAKMDILINGNSIHKMKNGSRLIVTSNLQDTLRIQVVYPLMKRYKSTVLSINPGDEREIYIDAYYWGTGFNPSMFITAERPEFNIELKKLDLQTGKEKFLDSTKFKDTEETIIKKNVP